MASILTRPLDGGSSSTNGTSVHSAQPRPSAAGKPSRTASSSILNTTSNRTLPLRNSCNACASTKLKCTKEKPSCSRCVKRAIPCAYVTSKRAGRKPSSRSAISEASPATSPQGTHGQIEDSMARGIDSADSANPDDLEEWLRILEGPITEGQSTDVDMDSLVDVPSAMDMDLDPNNILDFSGMDNMFSMAQLWSVRVDGRGNDNLGNDSTLVSATHDNLAASAPIIQSAPMWSPPVAQMSEPGEILDSTSLPTNSSAKPDQSSCTCGNGISDLMNRLTSMATKAQDTMARHNLDHSTVLRLALDVVTLNKEAISNLSVALCCPQDHDGTQILMMAFIVIKIGSSYSLITRECPTQCASGGSGSFGDSARASAHIVFGDLGRLRHIANQLSAKLRVYGATHEWAGSPNWSGQASSPLSSIIYSSLDTDLQRLVKTLSLNVIDRMTTTGS